jgi:outer membrane protein assembly factor BamB
VVAGGSVYVTGFDGNLSVFDAAGCGASACKLRWQGHTGNDITSSAAVADGLVLVGSADHLLYAFPADGCGRPLCQPRWTAQLGDAVIDSSVAVAGGVAYVGDSGGRLYAFTAKGCGAARCAPLWVGQAGAGQMLASPAVGGGRVFVGSFQSTPEEFTGNLFAFPAAGCGKATCKPSWSASLGGPAERDAAPLVSGGTVFMGSSEDFGGVNGNHLFAFAAAGCGKATCRPLRAYDVGDAGSTTTPALVGDTLLASTQATPDPNTSGVVAAFPAHGCGAAVCEPLWTGVNFADGFESSPVVAGNVVFVGKGPASGFPVDAGVYAFDARGCGKRICQPRAFVQLSTSQAYQGSSIAVSGGKVLLNSTDNTPFPAPSQTNLYVLALP